VLPGSSAGALREHRESFVRAERSVHVAAAARTATVFPAATLVKVSDYRKNVRTISLPSPPPPRLVSYPHPGEDCPPSPGFLNRVADLIDFSPASPPSSSHILISFSFSPPPFSLALSPISSSSPLPRNASDDWQDRFLNGTR